MEYKQIYGLAEMQELILSNPACLFYFSSDQCSVCKVLKPKLAEMIQNEFPSLILFYVNTELSPVVSGQYSIFTIPTILFFLEGKEIQRFSRNTGLEAIRRGIERPYGLFFGE